MRKKKKRSNINININMQNIEKSESNLFTNKYMNKSTILICYILYKYMMIINIIDSIKK